MFEFSLSLFFFVVVALKYLFWIRANSISFLSFLRYLFFFLYLFWLGCNKINQIAIAHTHIHKKEEEEKNVYTTLYVYRLSAHNI